MSDTLSHWLARHAKERTDAPALKDGAGTLTYKDLADSVARLGTGLAEIGIGNGDVVAAQLPNVRAFVIAFLAVTARGGIFQTLHMPYRRHELQTLLSDSRAKAVILTHGAEDSRATDVLTVRENLPDLAHVIVAGPPPESCLSFETLAATSARPDAMDVSAEDPYLLLYTSGTTGAPKGVPHAYHGFLRNAAAASRAQPQIHAFNARAAGHQHRALDGVL